jgi:hypothetical protein
MKAQEELNARLATRRSSSPLPVAPQAQDTAMTH